MMKSRTHWLKTHWIVVGIMILSLVMGACGGEGEPESTEATDNQAPVVSINTPPNQSVFQPGQVVQVDVLATDDKAVSRIELYVDNSLVESRVAPSGSALTTMREVFNWSASIVGSHALQARVYDTLGQMGASPIVAVTVGSPATATVPPTVPSTALPEETAVTPTSDATATSEPALVTASLNANVRGGPGTNYYIVGTLGQGESAMVTGRNADSSWWQITFQGSSAWVADSVVTANAAAYNAPVASAPPPPATNTPAPPTATPTSAAPTNTPAPTTGLRADKTSLSAGECTTLRWDFVGIKALYISFGYGYDKQGVDGSGSREVCPSVTTTYETTVVRLDGSQDHPSLTINASGSGCGDPVIKRFVPTTYDVAAGKPFSIFWEVTCAKTVHFARVGGGEEPVGGVDKKIDVTIEEDTVFQLKVEKYSGGFVYASFTVEAR